jgi:hypothetical protein
VVIVGTMILFEGSTGYIFARAKRPSNTESKPIVLLCCSDTDDIFFLQSVIDLLSSICFFFNHAREAMRTSLVGWLGVLTTRVTCDGKDPKSNERTKKKR